MHKKCSSASHWLGGRWAHGAAFVAVVAIAAAMMPSAARAGIITESQSVASTSPNWSQSLNFQGFNALAPAGNTLQSVTIALTETLSGSASATNFSSYSATGNFQITDTATLNAGGLGQVINQQNSETITIAPYASSSTVYIDGSSSVSNTYTSNLVQFLGPWSGAASDSGNESLNFTHGGDLLAGFTDTGALSVLVTYNYTNSVSPVATPEPGTLALLAAGLLGLGFSTWRRKRGALPRA